MPTEDSSEMKLDIGHVLFIDIVGYSRGLINEQSELLQKLKEIVRATEQFRLAEAEGKLLRFPTGDGGALVFRNSPEAPVLCAMEIAKALKSHPELRVRMGIHSGPVNEISDLNEQANIAGAGINLAQRVMDCGEAGHILLSRHVAEDLEHYPRWQARLHELGECEVKHGIRVSAVNLYNDEVGNPVVPERFRKSQTVASAAQPAVARSIKPTLVFGIISLAALVIVALLFGPRFFRLHNPTGPTSAAKSNDSSTASVSAKSIAVLPFDNLSDDKSNAYFAEGVQDEILTRLAKVADLKVISRTSTQHFKSAPENLPSIAKQLGVMNILEGSVQKSNDQVRVNVQLINALTDAHLWADIYDRKLTDIFAVESDIAKTIADTLQARLTGSEKQMMAAQPTSDTTAYELYHKGRSLWERRSGDNIPQAIAYYEQAIARDPNYALAYAGLANAYALLPFYTSTAQRDANPKAKEAARKALQLDPNLAEAHAALGKMFFFDEIDLAGAIREYQRAIELNPNYATAHQWLGNDALVSLGRFEEAIAENRRAVELDPLSPIINADLGTTLYLARRYDEADAQLRKALAIDPRFSYALYNLGLVVQQKGDLPGAIAQYEKAKELTDDPLILVLMAAARAQAGDNGAALRALTNLDNISQHREVLAYWRALLFLSLNNKGQAIHWLEQSFAERDGANIGWIKVDPVLDPLHGDPRFEALVQKVIAPKTQR
jgi:TolB-like protein/Tfp pilus assembly protein PilF/class 3 adenylate cyclase